MTPRSSTHPSTNDRPWTDKVEAAGGWFGVPERPRQFLARTRLLDALDADQLCPLVLVSAPAGTGKTTLVADWISTRAPSPAEWVTFDGDEPFWPGFVGCLDRLGVPVATTSLPAGDSALPTRARRALASSVASVPAPITVVVDGYEVESPAVAADLDFLLRHTGHRLRLVLLTRSDPVLPLYRYRLDESMNEVRMADLAFSDQEAETLLRGMGAHLTSESVRTVNARTKGWVTGLRFAGQLLADSDDPDEAIEQVVGSSGSIGEYLMGEVLARHSSEVRELLMATSVPDTIRPGLAEALVGRSGARALASFVKENAFIERVPGCAEHYRYHPLFRDLLRAELSYRWPDRMTTLQRRAGDWFAAEGLLAAAVTHYASAGAWDVAATQVVTTGAVGQLLLVDGSSALARALRTMPAALQHPTASVVRAALALADGDTTQFDAELGRIEVVGDDGGSHSEAVHLAVGVLTATRARSADDPTEARSVAEDAEATLGLTPLRGIVQRHPELQALVLGAKGIAAIREGELETAGHAFRAATAAAVDAGAELLQLECLGHLALVCCVTGDLLGGEALAQRAVEVAGQVGVPVGRRSVAARAALAWVAMEQYDLRGAAAHIHAAERGDVGEIEVVPRTVLALAKARLLVAQGDPAGALAGLSDAATTLADGDASLTGLLRLETSRLLVVAGKPEHALDVLEPEESHGAHGALVVAEARLQLGDEAGVAEALRLALDEQAPAPVRIQAWLVECGRRLGTGSTSRARNALQKALHLAAASQVRRPFHLAPPRVRQLLARDSQLTTDHEWLFGDAGRPIAPCTPGRRSSDPQPGAGPVENLTAKELEVLRHLSELLTTEEIASAMYISVNTVRTHVRSILRKLGVSRRNAAVRVARQLDLISS